MTKKHKVRLSLLNIPAELKDTDEEFDFGYTITEKDIRAMTKKQGNHYLILMK